MYVVTNVINHVRKDLYYATLVIVISRINSSINPIVLSIVIQYIYIYTRRTLDNGQIAIVEAVYICIILKSLHKDLENELIGLLRRNAYMFIYFRWLLYRWYPLYSNYDDHLPKKYTG